MRCNNNRWTCSGDAVSQGISITWGFSDLINGMGITEAILSIFRRMMEEQRVNIGYTYRILLKAVSRSNQVFNGDSLSLVKGTY
jgi:hypothetical protein